MSIDPSLINDISMETLLPRSFLLVANNLN